MSPGRHVEVEAVAGEAVTVALIRNVAEEINEGEVPAGESGHVKGHVALPLRRAVVHRRENASLARLPRRHYKLSPGEVPLPRRPAVPQAPLAVERLGTLHAFEELPVEQAQVLVDRFGRSAPE